MSLSLAEVLQRASEDCAAGASACSPCPATGATLRLAARLAARRVHPLPAGVGETGAVPWSLYLEDATAAVRVTFATSSGPPPVQLLEAEQDAEGRPRGAMLMVEGWQALLGQTSSSSQPPPQQQRKQGQRSPTELAPFCIEVSDWRRLHEEEEKEDTRGIGDAKRRRVEAAGGTSSKPPRPVYTEGLWATGVARAISPVLKGRRKLPPATTTATTSAPAPAVRAPSRAVVLLRLPTSSGGSGTVAIILQGERYLRCQPALRPGHTYFFPLLRPTDPRGDADDRADYWGEEAPVDGKEPPPVFVAGLPPVEMPPNMAVGDDDGDGDEGDDFAAQHGLFAYPDHRPHAAAAEEDRSARPTAASCLQARVVHFEGVIRAAHRNGKYDLIGATTSTAAAASRVVPVLLASPTLGLGAGLRKGARVRLWNVHPIALGGRVQALGGCLWTHVEIVTLAPPSAPPALPAAPLAARPYLLPANGMHRHRPLAYLAWTIRVRGQLQRKLFAASDGGPRQATATEAAALEPWINAWAKRLSGVVDIRADPLLPEAILHDTCSLPCPTVFGGLPPPPPPPLPPSHAPVHHPFQDVAAPDQLAPPSLVELPSIRAARAEAARRCREALLRGGWWPVLERAGAGRVETLPLGEFDLSPAAADDDESGVGPQLSRAVLIGLLVWKRGKGLRLVDATASVSLHFTLPSGGKEEEDEDPLVLWQEGESQRQPEPFVAAAAWKADGDDDAEGPKQEVEQEQERRQKALAAAVAGVRSLPWTEVKSPLTAEQAGGMMALSPGAGRVRLFAEVLSWRRGARPAGAGPVGEEEEEECMEVSFEEEGGSGATVVAKVRPFLLVDWTAALPLQAPAEPPLPLTSAPHPAPPPQMLPPTDWAAARLAPTLSVASRRARSDEYWDCPPLRLLVLVKRLEQLGYQGGGESRRIVLLCKDANDAAPAVARLFLYASHRAAHIAAPDPFPGAVLLARGLRCRTRPNRRIDLFSAPGCSILASGYRPLSPLDRHLARATFEEPCPSPSNTSHEEEEQETAALLLRSVRPGRLCELAQGRTVCFGLVRLQVMLICFKAPSLALKCPACRSFAGRCGGRCGVQPLEPWWEVHCTVDDGTGQANVLADGELAVRLLRVEPQRRQRLEAELRAGQGPVVSGAGYGANRREAVGEWLWAELFRDPGERARRLRRVEVVLQEILLKYGKGDGRPPPQQRLRRCEWEGNERRDLPTVWGEAGGGSGTSTYSLHMPALKAVLVAEADARLEAYEALQELRAV